MKTDPGNTAQLAITASDDLCSAKAAASAPKPRPPYRPCPRDFRERYLEMGWDGIAEHYRTNWRCIMRWIDECGGEALRAERRAITGYSARPQRRSRASRYVMGQTLSGQN